LNFPSAVQTAQRISTDGGKTWVSVTLGEEIGRFAFRTFSGSISPKSKGKYIAMARATNKIGQSQTSELIPNPAGYHHNLMHSIALTVT
jgi:sulfite dehydrogenase (cytochrome) subunit A